MQASRDKRTRSTMQRTRAHLPVVEHDEDVIGADAQNDEDAQKVQHADPPHAQNHSVDGERERQAREDGEDDERSERERAHLRPRVCVRPRVQEYVHPRACSSAACTLLVPTDGPRRRTCSHV